MSNVDRLGTSGPGLASRLRSILRKPAVRWLLRLAFSALILALLFTQVDLASVFAALRLADTRWLLPMLVLYFALRYIWAYQMSLPLEALGLHFSTPRLFVVILISTFYGLVLPGSVVTGGAVSWYKLTRGNGKRAEVGALLVYLRLIDTLVLLAIGLVGMWFDPHLSSPRFRALVAALFGAIVIVSLPFFFPAVTRPLERLGRSVGRRSFVPPWLRDKAGAVWRALKAFQGLSRGIVAAVFGLSLAAHLLGVVLFYLLALSVNVDLSILVIGWIRSLASMLQFIPVSLAGLGVREASLVLLLGEYGVAESQALAFSLAIFGLMVIGGLAGGLCEIGDVFLRRREPGGAPDQETTGEELDVEGGEV